MELDVALYKAFTTMKVVVPKNNKNITLDDIVLALTIDESRLPELLGYSAAGDGGFKHFRKRLLPNKPQKMSSYIRYILAEIHKQKCCSCNKILDFDSFHKNSQDRYYNLSYKCISCDKLSTRDPEKQKIAKHNHYIENKSDYISRNINRKLIEKKAIVPWSQKDKISEFYKNCPHGFHVDHIIPLQGKNVSGLHVLENLQYLPEIENLSKSNKFIIE